jgi:FKBP-type peptidyl-prolyl cis-trans isomerase SlyD
VKIAKGTRVRLKVELTAVGDAKPLEKSVVEYVHGGGTMLAGLEKVLEGLETGAKRDGVIKAKDAFGNAAMHPVKKLPRTEFPKDAKLEVGARFAAQGANGMNVILKVEKISGDELEVRYVHPLAEKDIKYSFEVMQVTDPRPPPVPAAALDLKEE